MLNEPISSSQKTVCTYSESMFTLMPLATASPMSI